MLHSFGRNGFLVQSHRRSNVFAALQGHVLSVIGVEQRHRRVSFGALPNDLRNVFGGLPGQWPNAHMAWRTSNQWHNGFGCRAMGVIVLGCCRVVGIIVWSATGLVEQHHVIH